MRENEPVKGKVRKGTERYKSVKGQGIREVRGGVTCTVCEERRKGKRNGEKGGG